jgi:O-acetyl-ADP-ribose deacetylase
VADDPTDADIVARLRAAAPDAWDELWRAADEVARLDEPARWDGGRTVDGVTQLPYPVYEPAVDRLMAALMATTGGIVVFGWMDWDGVARYRTPDAVRDAPIAEMPRLVTAIVRSERFSEGSIEGAVTSGLVAAIVRRLRCWYDQER